MDTTDEQQRPTGRRSPCAACGSSEHHRLQCPTDEPRRQEALRSVRSALSAVAVGAAKASAGLASLAGSAEHAAASLGQHDTPDDGPEHPRRQEAAGARADVARSEGARAEGAGAGEQEVERLRRAVDLLGEELVDARRRVAAMVAELDEARADGVIADAMVSGYAAEVADLRTVAADYERTVDLLLDEVVRHGRVRES